MKILITGPLSSVGRKVLRELLAPEFSVRVLARDPDLLPEETRGRVEVVRGSMGDVVALTQALDGVEALFWCVPGASLHEKDIRGHYEHFARAGSLAIRESGTRRVVTISAGGKGLARDAGPISGLHAMEEILNESGAAIRHLRCAWFMENFLRQARSIARRGVISYPMPADVSIPMVAVSDVADVALRWLARRDWSGVEAVAVHGPENLSYARAAAVIEQALERPVQYRELPANQYVRALVRLGASNEYARSRVEMFARLAQGISRAEPRTLDSTTATRLGTWAERKLLPVVDSIRAKFLGDNRLAKCEGNCVSTAR
jgi:uncharacterized protein YbjT (DUF2867 family)